MHKSPQQASVYQYGDSVAGKLQLLAPALQLRALLVAGWGDTAVVLDQLLATLPRLDTLYLEDVRLQLSEDGAKLATRNHGLSQLSVFHCSSRQV